MRVKWIDHKGKRIIFVDYSNIKDQNKLLAIIDEADAFLEQTFGKVLFFLDVTGATAGPDVVSKIKAVGVKHVDKFDKTAITGVVGLKALLLKGYNMVVRASQPTIPFATREEALDYLVS